MEDVNERPIFTQEQLDKELKQVVLLDRILAENGALTLKELKDIVSKIDNGNNFNKLNDLTTFIGMRTNIFEVSFDLVRNNSQEFREMFGYLVNFLCGIDQPKRTMELVAQVIMRFSEIVVREVGSSKKRIHHFLEKHRNFFILCGNETIMLNPTCLKIPSAWERKALPIYKNAIRYDRSIVLDGIGKVVSAVSSTGYIKIEIVRGPWTAQTVFGLSKNVSNEVNLAKKFPVGTLVKILAYRAYEAAHLWTATKVILADDRDDIWCVGETGRMDRLLEKYQLVKHERINNIVTSETAKMKSLSSSPNRKFKTESVRGSVSPQLMVNSLNREAEETETFRNNSISAKAEMEMNSNYRKFYNDIINDEIKKRQEVDECLRSGPKTFRQIFDKLIEGDTFAYYSYMVDFIVVRSHLYKVLENRVWIKSDTFRNEMLKFLRYIDEKSRENVTVNILRKLINANDGDFMEEFLIYTENANTFLKFIEEHASLIELAEAFGEQFIFLRGTYVSDYNIFVPKFHFPRCFSDH
ncbi:Pleckstrin [Dirofilaria immitis]